MDLDVGLMTNGTEGQILFYFGVSEWESIPSGGCQLVEVRRYNLTYTQFRGTKLLIISTTQAPKVEQKRLMF